MAQMEVLESRIPTTDFRQVENASTYSGFLTGIERSFNKLGSTVCGVALAAYLAPAALGGGPNRSPNSEASSGAPAGLVGFNSLESLVNANAARCPEAVYHRGSVRKVGFEWKGYNQDPYFPNVGPELSAYRRHLNKNGEEIKRELNIPDGAFEALKRATPCVGEIREGQLIDRMMFGGFWPASKVQTKEGVKVKFSSEPTAWYAEAAWGGKRWTLINPFECGNASVETTPLPKKPPKKPQPPKQPKPEKPEIFVRNICEDTADTNLGDNGDCPSDTFTIYVKIGNGKTKGHEYNPAPKRIKTGIFVGNCVAKQKIQVWETMPDGWAFWRSEPVVKDKNGRIWSVKTQVCKKDGNRFTFKKKQVSDVVPTPPTHPQPPSEKPGPNPPPKEEHPQPPPEKPGENPPPEEEHDDCPPGTKKNDDGICE